MKKIYLLMMLFLFAFTTQAQISVQGVPRTDLTGKQPNKKQLKTSQLDFSEIKYWVGSGSKSAAFVVQWNDSKNPDALVWGFRWDGNATGEDMLKAIAKADKRFYTLLYQGTQFGSAIAGFGFDLNGKNTNAIYKGTNITYPLYPLDGIINTTTYDFDDYSAIDAEDHWSAGWYNSYWSYWVKDPTDTDFGYSGVGTSTRVLENGSWDVWNFALNFNDFPISSTLTPVTPYSSAVDLTKGYFMVNEDWFGHTNGSVNFVGDDGEIHYRVYSEKNNNQAFGATTQYGTIYGDKFYFISKQPKDGGDTQYASGGRLVIANATTMEKIAGFDNIGGGDGRSFVGVDQNKGYIGASNGIFIFDIQNLQVGAMIPETGGGSQYSGQIGNMIRTSKYVFAVKQSKGILIIDPETNTLKQTITGAFHSIVQAKDGSIWAVQNQKLIQINPITFTTTDYAIPTTKYIGTWGAWNAGSFTYSTKQNALYWINSVNDWTSGSQIVKFDVTSRTFNENFAAIPGQNGTYKQIPYGAALRVNPVTDQLILNTTESGYGAHYQKNWIHTYDVNGTIIDTKTLNDYYWFPAITVFPDTANPTISADFPNEVILNAETKISLKNVIIDEDNISSAVVKTIKSNDKQSPVTAVINDLDELILTPIGNGTARIVIDFNSNGKVISKTLLAQSNFLAATEVIKPKVSIYPNPATDLLKINTSESIISIAIFDVTGKQVLAKSKSNEINVSGLIKGNYILQITTEEKTYTEKFIKK